LPETESRTKSLKRGAKLRLNEGIYSLSARPIEITATNEKSEQEKLLDVMVKYGNNPDGIPSLLFAAKKGDLEAVKLLLAHGADIHTRDAQGHTILKWALLSKDLNLVRFVLDQGADVNASGASGSFEALIVTTIDDPDIFDLLVERGVNFEKAQDNFGGICGGEEMLIPYCIRYNSDKLLRHLIQEGYRADSQIIWHAFGQERCLNDKLYKHSLGNFNYLLKTGILNPSTQLTPNSRAIYAFGELPVSFLQSCIDQKFNISLPLYSVSVTADYVEKLRLLIKNGAQVNAKDPGGRTALWQAVGSGNKEAVRLLLENGAQVNEKDRDGRTALWYANVEATRLLLENGAQVNEKDRDGRTVLLYTARFEQATTDSLEKLRLLIKNGSQVNAKDHDGRTALHYANAHTARLLLENGAQVNEKDRDGRTALLYTASFEQATTDSLEKLRLLIKNGSQVDAKDNNGCTAFYCVSIYGSVEAMRLLLENGAQVNAKDNCGFTALWNANVEKTRLLLQNGAQVNEKDSNGRTAFWNAVGRRDEEKAKLLLEYGTEVNAKDNSGQTALWEAVRNRFEEMVTFLLVHGADPNLNDNSNHTPIQCTSDEEMKKLLRQFGAKG
jgi:ankyrin repeat protein